MTRLSRLQLFDFFYLFGPSYPTFVLHVELGMQGIYLPEWGFRPGQTFWLYLDSNFFEFDHGKSSMLHTDTAPLWVDLSIVKLNCVGVRQTLSHQFEAKKLDIGEWQKWIELSLWNSLNEKHLRNWPLVYLCDIIYKCALVVKSHFRSLFSAHLDPIVFWNH